MLKRLPIITIIISISMLALSGCASDRLQNVSTTNLYDLETLTAQNTPLPEGGGLSKIRLMALKETATSIGAKGGLAWQSKKINESLVARTNNLDQIFDFQRLLLNHNVLPPVLVTGQQLLNIDGQDSIRIADQTYKIEQQARFVTTAPTWQSYLMMNFKKPALPDQTLLPRDDAERKVWIKYVRKGWTQGVIQAKNIYADNLARLKRDFNGMLLYQTLLNKNMVSKPYVAKSNMGVTSNSQDTQLYINDQVLRITALPKLNPNSRSWKAVATHEQQ